MGNAGESLTRCSRHLRGLSTSDALSPGPGSGPSPVVVPSLLPGGRGIQTTGGLVAPPLLLSGLPHGYTPALASVRMLAHTHTCLSTRGEFTVAPQPSSLASSAPSLGAGHEITSAGLVPSPPSESHPTVSLSPTCTWESGPHSDLSHVSGLCRRQWAQGSELTSELQEVKEGQPVFMADCPQLLGICQCSHVCYTDPQAGKPGVRGGARIQQMFVDWLNELVDEQA